MELPIMPLLTNGDHYPFVPVWWSSAGPLHAYASQSLEANKYFKRYVNQIPQSPVDKNKTLNESETFEAHIDVTHFKPEELTVKLGPANNVTIEGRHEYRADENGFIFRSFLRKFQIPDEFNITKLKSKWSSDGVLIVTAPRTENSRSSFTPIPIKVISKK